MGVRGDEKETMRKPKTIVAGMRAFAEQTNSMGVDGLIAVFADLQRRGPHPAAMTVSAQMRNRSKCRYLDIPCLDQTRVVLKPWPNAQGDFIHANWITHELLNNKIICTQAPLDATNGDFWRMVWQENVDTILMLCRVSEAGKVKCSQYWPKAVGETKTFCGITIKNEAFRSTNPDVWCTDLVISFGDEKRKMTHYQWVTWPDKFVPKQLVVPFMMLSLARTCKFPPVIHCSAGIGRTGTLVVLEIVIRSLLIGRELSIPDIIWSIRTQRSKSVQCEEQFLYIHYIVIQRFLNKGILSGRVVMNFCREYEHYYYSKTHTVQVPLPVFVRKRRLTSKAQPVGAADDSAKYSPKSRTPATNEKTATPAYSNPKKRVQIRRVKKVTPEDDEATATPLSSKESCGKFAKQREYLKGVKPDAIQVEKDLIHATEIVHQLLMSSESPNEIQQKQEQALQILGRAYQQAKTALELRVQQSNSPIISPAASLAPDGRSSPLRVIKTVERTSPSTPQPHTTLSPAAKPVVSPMNTFNIAKSNEKIAETVSGPGNAAIENPDADGEEDDDAVASYYFIQPEWPSVNNQKISRNSNEMQEKNEHN